MHDGVLDEKSLIYISVVQRWDQYGLLVPVDSLECDAVLMSLRAQRETLTQIKVNRLSGDGSEESKINSPRAEIKRYTPQFM